MDILTPSEYEALHNTLLTDRQDYDQEWKQINNYLLTGRALFTGNVRPRKRVFTPPKTVNQHGTLALQTLQSGMQGGLTNPASLWFDFQWPDERLKKVPILQDWLATEVKEIYKDLGKSNFYQTMHAGYGEFAGYGNICVGLFADEDPFFFTLLTAGEYVATFSATGELTGLYRQMFMTAEQMVTRWPNTISDSIKNSVKANPNQYHPVLHVVHKADNYKLPFYSVYVEQGQLTALQTGGYDEMPYFFAPWDLVGSDDLGTGPGSAALPDITRLQEIEKTFLMAAHKDMDPPVQAPARKRGKVNTLPGGMNYYRNKNETISELYQIDFDYQGSLLAVDRIETRIGRFFYNDVFLTASRDPNASPLRTGEVNERREERLIKIGPVLDRLHTRVFSLLLKRVHNIRKRAGRVQQLPPEFAKFTEDFDVDFISQLAKSQKLLQTRSIADTLTFAASVAQVKPEVLDKVDGDAALNEFADASGAPASILKSDDEVAKIRQQRAEAQAQQAQQQNAILGQQMELARAKEQSEIAQNYAGAGLNVGQALEGVTGVQ